MNTNNINISTSMRISGIGLAIIIVLCMVLILPTSSVLGATRPTPTPTRKAPPRFSRKSAKKAPTPDILKQILTFGPPGGVGYWSCNNEGLLTLHPILEVSRMWTYAPTHELMTTIALPICGVKAGENIQLRVQYPNGREFTVDFTAQEDAHSQGKFLYEFHTTLQDPPGNYRFTLNSPNGGASLVYSYILPVKPRVYWLGDGRMTFINFRPNERFRMLAYTKMQLDGWQEFQVDGRGRMEIAVDYPEGTGLVVLRDSPRQTLGILANYDEFLMAAPIFLEMGMNSSDQGAAPPPPQTCTGPQPPRLSVGGSAYVITGPLAIRKSPSQGAPLVRSVQSQSRMVVVDGPVCAEGYLWWRVVTPKGYDGWIIEGDASGYFVNPGQ